MVRWELNSSKLAVAHAHPSLRKFGITQTTKKTQAERHEIGGVSHF